MVNKKRNYQTGKKAQSAAILMILTMFSLLITVVVGFFFFSIKPVYDDVTDDMIQGFQLNNQSAQILIDTNERYPVWLDNGFLWLIGGIWFSMLIMAYYSNDHPVLLLVIFIVFVVLIFAAAIVSNVWYDFSTTDTYNDYRLEFPFTDWALSHLPYVLGVMGFSCLIVYFVRVSGVVGL